jgi:putative DNA-invertase from lambdoid prophage Rac
MKAYLLIPAMSRIAYYRVSSSGQSIESQRHAMGESFDKEFSDDGVSGAIPAATRPGFAALLNYAREGDVVCVNAVDRLGRDALDVQRTVRNLIGQGITVEVKGLGTIAKGVGELILAVLAQVADMERQRIVERTHQGRQTAREALKITGLTHRGKKSLGRPLGADPEAVRAFRRENAASIADTAIKFGLSKATVKRYCAS